MLSQHFLNCRSILTARVELLLLRQLNPDSCTWEWEWWELQLPHCLAFWWSKGNKVRVGSSRVIRPPVELLGKERVLEDAATTLFSLSKFREIREQIIKLVLWSTWWSLCRIQKLEQLARGTRLSLSWLTFCKSWREDSNSWGRWD